MYAIAEGAGIVTKVPLEELRTRNREEKNGKIIFFWFCRSVSRRPP